MSIEASFETKLQQDIARVTFGAGEWILFDKQLTNADGVLKMAIKGSNEEYFEIIGVDSVSHPNEIQLGKRGLSLTSINPLTEVSGNIDLHFAGEQCAVVTFPNTLHSQNTDTGTSSTTFEIGSSGDGATLDSDALTADRNYTFLDRDGQLADVQYVADTVIALGSGDVAGNGLSTDNAIARYDSTTGKIIQTSLASIDDSGSINIPTGESYKINGTALASTNIVNSTTSPATNTDNNIPQWNGADSKLLKNGLSLVTEIGSTGSDSSVPTEQAVREGLGSLLKTTIIRKNSDQNDAKADQITFDGSISNYNGGVDYSLDVAKEVISINTDGLYLIQIHLVYDYTTLSTSDYLELDYDGIAQSTDSELPLPSKALPDDTNVVYNATWVEYITQASNEDLSFEIQSYTTAGASNSVVIDYKGETYISITKLV